MNVNRYRFLLYLHTALIIVDLLLNTLVDVFKPENVIQLVLYVLQDTCILFDVIVLFLSFFSTYVFQAGLVWILVSKFSVTIFVNLFYLGLSVSLHTWKLTLCWDDPRKYIWSSRYLTLYVVQRMVAVFFYYSYKRTMLLIADPRFYKRSQWIQNELSTRN